MDGEAEEQARRVDAEVKRQRRKEFLDTLDDAVPQAAGFLHRISKWRPEWQPARGSISKKELSANVQEAVNHEAKDWQDIWRIGGLQRKAWAGARLSSSIAPIDLQAMRRICRAFEKSTGLGVDGWQPRHWSWL